MIWWVWFIYMHEYTQDDVKKISILNLEWGPKVANKLEVWK